MTDVLAIISRAAFEKGLGGGEVGTVKAVSTYDSNPKPFAALRDGGDGALFLVTARPEDKLWLVAILEKPRLTKNEQSWIAQENVTPITDITSLIPKLKFASGTGIKAKAGQLGMSLQTPRALTKEDVSAIRGLVTKNTKGTKGTKGRAPAAPASSASSSPTPATSKLSIKLREAMADGDADAFLVYADLLLQHGDPRGDLIQVQHQRLQKPKDKKLLKAEADLLARHGDAWLPESLVAKSKTKPTKTKTKPKKVKAPTTAFTWRLGFLDSVTLVDATPAMVRAVVDHPSSQFLRELRIDAGFRVTPGVILALAAKARPSIRSLTLRQGFEAFSDDIAPDPKDPSYKSGYADGANQDRGNALWKALPNLRSLVLKGYQVFGKLAHDSLEELTIDGYPICNAAWNAPKLSRLTWEVGDDETGTNTDAASYMVEAIWKGKLPALRHLNLGGCSAIIDDELMDEEDEDGELPDDTCAVSLLRHKGFRRVVQQLDELCLPETDLKSRKEIGAWLAKQTRR